MPLVQGSTPGEFQALLRVRPLDGALLPRRRRCGGGSLVDGRGGGGDLGRRRARRRDGVAARAVGSAIATPSPTPTTTTTTTTATAATSISTRMGPVCSGVLGVSWEDMNPAFLRYIVTRNSR